MKKMPEGWKRVKSFAHKNSGAIASADLINSYELMAEMAEALEASAYSNDRDVGAALAKQVLKKWRAWK